MAKKSELDIPFKELTPALKELLNGDYGSFNFDDEFLHEAFLNYETMDEFEKTISKFHENSIEQKKNGVFYTPSDVCDYILYNSVQTIYCSEKINFDNPESIFNWIINNGFGFDFIFNRKVLDPTSGTGEFLVSVLKLKLRLLKAVKPNYSVKDICTILETLHGNDIDTDANNISKVRLFIQSTLFLKECNLSIVKSIKSNFSKNDFTLVNKHDFSKFDLIIGNPPYVEKGRKCKYGNLFADILDNTSNFTKKNGAIGFIIPLSYVSTQRMNAIRNVIESNFSKQLIANYADRPASLFTKAHQKLTILIATNNSSENGIFVSNYQYFYKEERRYIFKRKDLVKLNTNYDYYPKVGSVLELTILDKILNCNSDNFLSLIDKDGLPIYLNMRGYFWTKAFGFAMDSSEYKELKYPKKIKCYILCLLNSSLFWWFWIVSSDCWHITKKELIAFSICVNDEIDYLKFDQLAKELEIKLENTKIYIGTIQTDYAYKHKCCKSIIDKIDDELAKIYRLSSEEINLIKNYALKYRIGKDDE